MAGARLRDFKTKIKYDSMSDNIIRHHRSMTRISTLAVLVTLWETVCLIPGCHRKTSNKA